MFLFELFQKEKKISTIKKSNMDENKRLYSSITLREIPEKYKKLKLLGRGTTSIVYEYDKDNVLVFTKDKFKYYWLKKLFGDKAKYLEELKPKESFGSKENYGNIIDVFVIPKLLPLEREDKLKVKKFIKAFYEEYHRKLDEYYKKYGLFRKRNTEEENNIALETLQNLTEKYDFVDFKNQTEKLIDFLLDLDQESYVIDFQLKNFMKNTNNEIVFLDPIADKEIIDFYYENIKNIKKF